MKTARSETPDRRWIAVALFLMVGSSALSAVLAEESTHQTELHIAVAANFSRAAERLAALFERNRDVAVVLIPGSTGKHFAQIVHGAPFDVFLAADVVRPARLVEQGLAVPGTRFTYALGRLGLWSSTIDSSSSPEVKLKQGTFRRLSMANPRLAPYGEAARQTLIALNLWESLQPRIVRAENVAQAMHFAVGGGADLAFVALAQLVDGEDDLKNGGLWTVPERLYSPIEQQVVLLVDTSLGREFLSFLGSETGRSVIVQQGYGVP